MTKKENFIRLLRYDEPEYIPYGLESVKIFWHRDAKFFFGNGDPAALEWTDVWGVDWKFGDIRAPESFYPVTYPIKNMDDLDEYIFPDPNDPQVFADVKNEINKLDRSENLLMLSNPGCLFTRAWLLRGMENYLTDMLLDTAAAEALLDRVLAYQMDILRQELAFKPDLVYFGDDAGTTRALMINPALWRKMIKPRLAVLTGMCRDAGCFVILHSCGKAEDIIDDFIEIGVDIFNPVQASANDLALLKSKARGKLIFYGGMDSDLLVRGSPDEVADNAARVLRILGEGGGYVAYPDQSLPFPKKNIDALQNAVKKYGRINGRNVL
jgi:uroporphyrinogen decarboxylase